MMKWESHVVRMGQVGQRNQNTGENLRKKQYSFERNIKIDPKEIGFEDVD
jgi:hypothetical protein